MPLLRYTTQISAQKTAGEIQGILAGHGATVILTEYQGGEAVALSFKVTTSSGEVPFRLPIDPDAVLKVLNRDVSASYRYRETKGRSREQAVRVAWRIVKAWVEAQMAIVETEMVTMEEVFLPYMLVDGKNTLYHTLQNRGFALPPGGE